MHTGRNKGRSKVSKEMRVGIKNKGKGELLNSRE